MKKVFVSEIIIEFEWGSFSNEVDGCFLSDDLTLLKDYIKNHGNEKGKDYSWVCSEPKEFLVEDGFDIEPLLNEDFESGLEFYLIMKNYRTIYLDCDSNFPWALYEKVNFNSITQ